MDLKETEILGDSISSHWYYRSKAQAVRQLLGDFKPSVILDVGAGSGFFSRHLLQHTTAGTAWCVDTSYTQDSHASLDGKSIHFRRTVDAMDADLVLFMDVLEHVDNDVELLSDYVQKVPRGAYFLISVPAFQFLWSGHDEFLEHKRRYRLQEIEGVAMRSGLKIQQGIYYFGAVFPIAATIRLLQKVLPTGTTARSQLSQHHPAVNGLLAALSHAELRVMGANRLAGLSAFCLARKP